MILQRFDQGWGHDLPLKQLEHRLLQAYLKPMIVDQHTKLALVNSTWYTDQYHCHVLSKLQPDIDAIILVSMLDATNITAGDFKSVCPNVLEVGYFNSDHNIDFWAIMVNEYFHSADGDHRKPIHPFICLNRKPHAHRLQLIKNLYCKKLIHRGLISLGANNCFPTLSLPNDDSAKSPAPDKDSNQLGIPNDIASLGSLTNWHNSLLNIVTETVYDIEQVNFVSEKIYKPIWGMRPFLVYAPNGAANWLAQRGFEPYTTDWADIYTGDLHDPVNIPEFLAVLCEQSTVYFESKLLALWPKIQHNKQNFLRYTSQNLSKINQGIKWPT